LARQHTTGFVVRDKAAVVVIAAIAGTVVRKSFWFMRMVGLVVQTASRNRMAEFLVRFVFEIVLLGVLKLAGRFGRLIAGAVVPLVARERVLIEPVSGNRVVVRRWHGLHRLTDGTPVMGTGLAAVTGFAILAAVLALAIVMRVLLR
jgi:hypothetical protein